MRALESETRRLSRRIERLERVSDRYSWVRLAVFVVGLLAAGLAFYFGGPGWAVVSVAAAALLFGVVVYYHHKVEGGIARRRGWLDIKLAHVARASLDWERIPALYPQAPRPSHPFELDLNVVGPRSLHHLLDTAVSYEGSQRLRDWLTAPVPDPGQTHARQHLVRELTPLHLFRDRLTLRAGLAAETDREWRANRLVEWLEGHAPDRRLGQWLLLLCGLAAVDAALFVAHQLALIPPWWQITLLAYLGVTLYTARAVGRIWSEAMTLQDEMRRLQSVFAQLERFSYHSTPNLRELCEPFLNPTHRPSGYMARLTRSIAALGLRGNPLVQIILNVAVPWDAFFAYRLDRYKADLSGRAREWMDVWYQLEALSSLATFAYLNPDYVFPEVFEADERTAEPVYRAEGLGHPLIPDGARVRNDFAFSALGEVGVMSGSNMAGKSVFLKTVAVSLVLAHAGAAVSARSLSAAAFRVFTSMAISDSVTDGISYFYAEVRRLRALLTELEREHPLPLLFCIDELFRGTNNRERLVGGRAYVRALAGKRGVGLIATHDLELAKLADEVPSVSNYHFRDGVEGDRMVFDYTLRSGPCPTTNALRIMRLQGLPVPAPGEGDA